MHIEILLLSLSVSFGNILLGGGLYELLVVDPFWPKNVKLIQTNQGGISRMRFWALAHISFEISLLSSLAYVWKLESEHVSSVLYPLAAAFLLHILARVWSFAYFIPRAGRFELVKVEDFSEADAYRWTFLSRFRVILSLVDNILLFIAFNNLGRLM